MSSESPRTPWAAPDDWKVQRDTITQLYWDQDLPLAKVMEVMEREHNFFATQKMYKNRLNTWGLFKTRQTQHAAPKRRPASNRRFGAGGKDVVHVTHGGLVGPVKVQRAPKRAQSLGQTKTTRLGTGDHVFLPGMVVYAERIGPRNRAPSPLSSNVSVPENLRLPEICIKATLDFTSSRFETGKWKFTDEDDDVEQVGLCGWSNRVIVATEMIQRGKTKAGFRMLQTCFQQYQPLILEGHPLLFQKSLGTMLRFLQIDPGLAASFVRYAASLCPIVLGDRHPLAQLWLALQTIESSSVPLYVRLISQAQCGNFLEILGPRNKNLAVTNLENARNYHKFGIIPLSAATEIIKKIGDELASDIQYWTMDYVLWAKIELAYTYSDGGNLVEAHEVLQYIGDRLQAPSGSDGVDLWTKTQYYMLKARVTERLGIHDEATAAYKARLEMCLREVGPDHSHTTRALGDLESHYRKMGEVEASENLRLDFETKWKSVSESDDSLPDAALEIPS